MVSKETKHSNGTKIKLEETPYYYNVTVGGKVWYWNRETSKFDGTSWQVADQLTPRSFSQPLADSSVTACPTCFI